MERRTLEKESLTSIRRDVFTGAKSPTYKLRQTVSFSTAHIYILTPPFICPSLQVGSQHSRCFERQAAFSKWIVLLETWCLLVYDYAVKVQRPIRGLRPVEDVYLLLWLSGTALCFEGSSIDRPCRQYRDYPCHWLFRLYSKRFAPTRSMLSRSSSVVIVQKILLACREWAIHPATEPRGVPIY